MSVAVSASSAGPSASRRDEAGPLPPKVGELSYARYDTAVPSSPAPDAEDDITDAAAAAAYAANNDRANASASASSSSRNAPTVSSASSATATATATAAAASTTSLPAKQLPWYKRILSAKAGPLVAGLRGPTLAKFFGLVSLVALIGVTWGISTQHIARTQKPADGAEGDNDKAQMAAYMGLFLHVAFAIACLVLLIFTERCLFVLRAERWLYKHPGEVLPLNRGGRYVARPAQGGLAPWNRPPLPTYAAALGYRGTGDVEDEAIAANPPPAYGNTRGSVLLLASAALRRVSSASASAGNRLSQLRMPMSPRTPRTPREFQQIPESRPVSYMSTEGVQDIERAHQLEMSLARLEAGPSSSVPPAR